MEIILECFFEKCFAELERSSLSSRTKRGELVNYFNTVIEGCCAGENSTDVTTTCSQAIQIALDYHTAHKKSNGNVCLMGKYHNVLYLAVKICYDWNLPDTPLIAKLLTELYDCEKTFERIFVGAIFGSTAPHFIAGWKSDFKNRDDNVKALIYFLRHATNAKLTFKNDLRFVDVPIESCGHATPLRVVIQLGSPDLLLILLRFGATVHSDDISSSAIETILDRLQEYQEEHIYPFTLVACLKFLLRSMPAIRLPLMYHDKELDVKRNIHRLRNIQTGIEWYPIPLEYQFLIKDGLVAESRCGLTPPELKHLARCAIRKRLWENNKLPYGVHDLHVSEEMEKYLDLQID